MINQQEYKTLSRSSFLDGLTETLAGTAHDEIHPPPLISPEMPNGIKEQTVGEKIYSVLSSVPKALTLVFEP